MTRRSRYGLLIAGLIVFIVGAPALVLYVRGQLPNLEHKRTELTGIISAETDPSGADIAVNGKKETSTPGAVRFLPTGDYTVSISKKGYKTWEKRLPVLNSRVTHVNPNPNPLLLLRDVPPSTIANNADLVATIGKHIVYKPNTEPKIFIFKDEAHTTATAIPLPRTVTSISADDTGAYALLSSKDFTGVLDIEKQKIIDYSKQFSNPTNPTLHNGSIVAIMPDGTLARNNPGKPGTVSLASHVLTYTLRGSELYYIAKQDGNVALHHALVTENGIEQEQILSNALPKSTDYQIYVDTARAVYITANGSLYRINEAAQLVAQGVLKATTESGSLAYTTSGELWWYDSGSNKPRLVSRSSEPFGDFYIEPALQYAFYAQGNNVIALELDDRAGQNKYVLDAAASQPSDIRLIGNDTLLYQTDHSIKIVSVF